MLKLAPLLLALPLVAGPALAQPASGYPKKIPAPGGEVIIPAAPFQAPYDEFHYAPARRAGDYLYVSGVVAGPIGKEGRDAEAFRKQVRRAFGTLGAILKASGAGFGDVVMINSFHVWKSDNFQGTQDEQIAIVGAVKDEFMPPPHPAWTAVGTTGLFEPTGVVEIQLIAYVPRGR